MTYNSLRPKVGAWDCGKHTSLQLVKLHEELHKLRQDVKLHLEARRPKCTPVRNRKYEYNMDTCGCRTWECVKCGQKNNNGDCEQCGEMSLCGCIIYYCKMCDELISIDTLPSCLPTCVGKTKYRIAHREWYSDGNENDDLIKELGYVV